jgi:protein ImuA
MIDHLRQRLQALQKAPGIEGRLGVLPFGIPTIDTMLGGGLARSALHEIAATGEAHLPVAAGFALAVAKRAAPSPRLFWVSEDIAFAESGVPHGAGLDAFGLPPEQLVMVSTTHRRDLLWAMEEALRCGATTAVIGEMRAGAIDGVAIRRLSLAAAESGTLALLLRTEPPGDASTAATRWVVGAAPNTNVIPGREHSERTRNPEMDLEFASGFRVRPFGPSRNDEKIRTHLAAQLVRNRRGPTGTWILEWSDGDGQFILATHAQPLAAPALDRPHRQVA